MAKKKCNRSSGIGGQAVLEGVMMKNKEDYAVAIRKPNGEIDVDMDVFPGTLAGSKIKNVPFIRGVFNFVDSLRLGMKALNHSADFYEDEDVKESFLDKALNKISGGRGESILMGFTTCLSVLLAVGIFILLPYFISAYLAQYVRNDSLLAIMEGVIRIVIFLLYVVGISLMKDIHRLYQYHGAEHKCINCIEKGKPLTVQNVKRCSRIHKRCGTSFMFFVIFVSVILFFFIRVDNTVYKVLLRIALIPVIAGISYEIIRLAGRSENIFVNIISAPGMLLQRLTTKEPDESMIEVAIKAVEAVFDWKAYIKETFGYEVEDLEVQELAADEAEGNEEDSTDSDEAPETEGDKDAEPSESDEAGAEVLQEESSEQAD
ncbi:MAG: DUF1385 domain-containing protein [Lachnospiraceae bacterium]|nr:DUF1385 domain-containing protein [Lachnospiraceae bacterium]